MNLQDYYTQQAQQHYDQPRPSTLGLDCCQICGRPRQECTSRADCDRFCEELWAPVWAELDAEAE